MISVKSLSKLTKLTRNEIYRRCKILQIEPSKSMQINNFIYHLSIEDVGKICLFDLKQLPKVIIKTETICFFESKMNNN